MNISTFAAMVAIGHYIHARRVASCNDVHNNISKMKWRINAWLKIDAYFTTQLTAHHISMLNIVLIWLVIGQFLSFWAW